MASKQRVDVRLAESGLAQSRAHAQALILAGEVLLNGQQVQKASQLAGESDELTIKEKLPFVSRGGLKLQRAFEAFTLDVTDKLCLDVGASTGGFTDCLLQHGAKLVYAVDVGHGQLHYSLRQHPQVVCMERVNARTLTVEDIQTVDFACADVSFISLKLILPPIHNCLRDEGQAVVLIKPQFEAGRQDLQKGGVVRDRAVRKRVCAQIMDFAQQNGFCVQGLERSPVLGPKGNEEYVLWLCKCMQRIAQEELEAMIEKAVSLA